MKNCTSDESNFSLFSFFTQHMIQAMIHLIQWTNDASQDQDQNMVEENPSQKMKLMTKERKKRRIEDERKRKKEDERRKKMKENERRRRRMKEGEEERKKEKKEEREQGYEAP